MIKQFDIEPVQFIVGMFLVHLTRSKAFVHTYNREAIQETQLTETRYKCQWNKSISKHIVPWTDITALNLMYLITH